MEDDEDSDSPPSPVKSHSLTNFVKEKSGMRARGDAIDALHQHLEFAAERTWLEANLSSYLSSGRQSSLEHVSRE